MHLELSLPVFSEISVDQVNMGCTVTSPRSYFRIWSSQTFHSTTDPRGNPYRRSQSTGNKGRHSTGSGLARSSGISEKAEHCRSATCIAWGHWQQIWSRHSERALWNMPIGLISIGLVHPVGTGTGSHRGVTNTATQGRVKCLRILM